MVPGALLWAGEPQRKLGEVVGVNIKVTVRITQPHALSSKLPAKPAGSIAITCSVRFIVCFSYKSVCTTAATSAKTDHANPARP